MEIRPLHDKIVIERLENKNTTESGIILQRSSEPDRAKVIAIGPEADEVSIGDVVLVDWNAATKIHDYYVISIKSVVFIYEE